MHDTALTLLGLQPFYFVIRKWLHQNHHVLAFIITFCVVTIRLSLLNVVDVISHVLRKRNAKRIFTNIKKSRNVREYLQILKSEVTNTGSLVV